MKLENAVSGYLSMKPLLVNVIQKRFGITACKQHRVTRRKTEFYNYMEYAI